MKRVSIVAAAIMAALTARTAELPAGWSDDFAGALAEAEAANLPIVVCWGNTMCSHCNTLTKALNDSRIAEFVAKHPAKFVVKHEAYGSKNPDYVAAQEWITGLKDGELGGFPYVGIYWKRPNEQTVSRKFTGRAKTMYVTMPSGDLAGQFLGSLEALIGECADDGAHFAVGGTASDRLEADADTRWVEVPIVRNLAAAGVKTTFKAMTEQGQPIAEESFIWNEGEASRTVRVEIPERLHEAGKTIALRLENEGNYCSLSFDSAIHFVGEVENSPKNPLWLGERTLETLKAGEWTMDYELAKERAAKVGKPMLVLIGGSLWCPDCVKVDHYLLNTPEFKSWLSERDVSCVAIDVPNVPGGQRTSLLTYEPKEVSDRYVNATKPPQDRVQSGAGYLSRHMIAQSGNNGTNATAIAERNAGMLTNDVNHAGLCRPENLSGDNGETGVFKTGIPCLIMIRADGTVAGRLYQFNNVSPGDTDNLGAYIQRMEEMLTVAEEDASEEGNAAIGTTPDEIATSGSRQATISATDQADVYKMAAIPRWATGSITLKSEAKPASATMAKENNVSLVLTGYGKGEDGAMTPTAKYTAKGNIFTGVTLENLVINDPTLEWGIEVRAMGTVDNNVAGAYVSKTFELERADDSTTPYTLTTAIVHPASRLRFAESKITAKEKSAGTMAIKLVRELSAACKVSGLVRIKESATTAEDCTYEFEPTRVSWENGDTEPKYVQLKVLNDYIYDGDRTIALELVDLRCDEEQSAPQVAPLAEESSVEVTVKEDDKRAVGTLNIVSTEPAMAKSSTVYARPGTEVKICVERANGASGCVTAEVTTVAGEWLGTNRLVWADREREALKSVTLRLPETYEKSSFKVTLNPLKGISASKRTLTVQLIEDDLAFEKKEVVEPTLKCHVAYSNEVAIVNDRGGKLSVTKLSGSLPSGISAKLVGKRLVVSGVPTTAKTYEAFYQVKEARPKPTGRGTETISGMTLHLAFTISDVTKPSADGEEPLNATIAKSRTFKGIPLVSATERRLVGIIDSLTIPKSGKVSAKYRCEAGDISLSAKSWRSCGFEGQPGTMTASLVVKNKPYAMTVYVRADGTVGYEFGGDPAIDGEAVSGEVDTAVWAKTNSAAAWQGLYTVLMPLRESHTAYDGVPAALGDAWACLNMTSSSSYNSGKMSYAGYLPNGKSFSGSAQLVRTKDGETAILPFRYRSSTTEYFTGMIEIAADAKVAYESSGNHRAAKAPLAVDPVWKHRETTKTEDGSYDCRYDLFGAYYDKKEDIAACARSDEHFGDIDIFFNTDENVEFDKVMVDVTDAKLQIVKNLPNPNKLSLTFNRSTGVVYGSFKFYPEGSAKAVSASYRGVMMPGWGGCGDCDPSTVYLPLAGGAYWFSDKLYYNDGKKEKSLSMKSGGIWCIQ